MNNSTRQIFRCLLAEYGLNPVALGVPRWSWPEAYALESPSYYCRESPLLSPQFEGFRHLGHRRDDKSKMARNVRLAPNLNRGRAHAEH